MILEILALLGAYSVYRRYKENKQKRLFKKRLEAYQRYTQ